MDATWFRWLLALETIFLFPTGLALAYIIPLVLGSIRVCERHNLAIAKPGKELLVFLGISCVLWGAAVAKQVYDTLRIAQMAVIAFPVVFLFFLLWVMLEPVVFAIVAGREGDNRLSGDEELGDRSGTG